MTHAQQPGGISVGRPGLAATRYTAVDGPVAEALNAFESRNPWIVPHSRAVIAELMGAGVTYQLDTLDDLFRWARIRLVTTGLLEFLTAPGDGANKGERNWKRWYALVEAQRQTFQQTGDRNGEFTFLGVPYTLARSGHNHYYASRAGATITYSGRLTDSNARAVVRMLHEGKTVTDPARDTGHIDEFVCAFLAEPTRWPEEQVFNLMTINANPEGRALTGNVGSILLPMASGTTWEPGTGVLGAQVPTRVVAFAGNIGLTVLIEQEIGAGSLAAFRTAVRGQLAY